MCQDRTGYIRRRVDRKYQIDYEKFNYYNFELILLHY